MTWKVERREGALGASEEESRKPIGVFDSGIGGLTVLRSLLKELPGESFVYLGDTARLPYGNKSRSTVTRYAFESLLFLLRHQVKAVVVACNTVASSCEGILEDYFRVPIVGVIEPAVREALEVTAGGRIGVLGTRGTVESGAYQKRLAAMRPDLTVRSQACPLLVPLVEEDWLEKDATRLILDEYLAPLIADRVDTVILGCTHYPVLVSLIQEILGPDVRLVESGPPTARTLKAGLAGAGLSSAVPAGRRVSYFLTDLRPEFKRVGERFLDHPIDDVQVVPGGFLV